MAAHKAQGRVRDDTLQYESALKLKLSIADVGCDSDTTSPYFLVHCQALLVLILFQKQSLYAFRVRREIVSFPSIQLCLLMCTALPIVDATAC